MILCSNIDISDWINWTTIAANIATVLGVIGVAITVLVFFKNKVTKKTIQIKITALNTSCFYEENKRVHLDIDLYNFTNKQFFITTIEFVINDQHATFSELYQPYYNSLYETRDIKNISVIPHEAMTIEGFIDIPNNIKLPEQIIVLIGTTEKSLSFLSPIYKTEYFHE